MYPILKLAICGVAAILGAATGAVIAFLGTVYSFMFIDWLSDNHGADAYFCLAGFACFGSVPVGVYLGGWSALYLTALTLVRRASHNSNEVDDLS